MMAIDLTLKSSLNGMTFDQLARYEDNLRAFYRQLEETMDEIDEEFIRIEEAMEECD